MGVIQETDRRVVSNIYKDFQTTCQSSASEDVLTNQLCALNDVKLFQQILLEIDAYSVK